MGFTFHGYDLNDTSQINYFVTAGLNDIVFTIFTVKFRPPGAVHFTQRGHDFLLPDIKYDFNKRHFVARSLFNYV